MVVPTKMNSANSTGIKYQVQEVKEDMYLNYVAFGWSVSLLLIILIYFPSKPPTSPSVTASIDRLDFKTGLKRIMKNKKMWILSLCFAIRYTCQHPT